MESRDWWINTPLATLLLCGAAALFILGYLPERKRADMIEAKVMESKEKIERLVSERNRAEQRIAELESSTPESLEEAIREVLHKGKPGEFLPPGEF